jgi:hypothetical protein
MKAKLIKTGSDYLLRDMGGNVLAITNGTTEGRKLSKQNCDEIFGVVDVEKLSEEYVLTINDEDQHVDAKLDFIAGYNEAMELNKDKVFTLEDIKIAIQFGWDDEAMIAKEISDKYGFNASEYHSENIIPFIQSLQQPTEIEVEIEMEDVIQLKKRAEGITNMGLPKLDSEGCLILKINKPE